MAYFERIRDVISEPFSPEIIRQRAAAVGKWFRLSGGASCPTPKLRRTTGSTRTFPLACASPMIASGSKSIPTRTRSWC